MTNVFNGLTTYAGNWSVINRRDFNSEEKAAVKSASVVASQYGSSVCFIMKGGGQTYIPVSRDGGFAVGDSVDLDSVELLTLHRDGDSDIIRVSKK
jgi:hypothetical protein